MVDNFNGGLHKQPWRSEFFYVGGVFVGLFGDCRIRVKQINKGAFLSDSVEQLTMTLSSIKD